jgi:hypothetical protein
LSVTREEALQTLISIARKWGENTEEALAGGRIHPNDTDEYLRDAFDVAFEQARTVRDLWRAITVLEQPKQEYSRWTGPP